VGSSQALRDFETWSAGRHCVRVAASPAELDEGFSVLCGLHGERWSARGHEGAFGSARFTAFHREVMHTLLAHAALELAWITVGNEPVAATYNLIWNRKVYFYQSGRRLGVPKGIKPGIVAHAYAIQRAIAAGLREYDFLGGRSQYKSELATGQRPLANLHAARPSLREHVRRLGERGLDVARRWRATAV
jgi:CelD/BcsL family acetyltransferase involved in cellulose biosynthesis